MTPHRLLGMALAALLATGCVETPELAPHERPLSPDQLGLELGEYITPDNDWWRTLGDSQLDLLMDRALAHNPGLGAALARVRSAWEQSVITGAASKPQLELETYLDRQHASSNYIYPPPFAGASFWSGSFGARFGWQLDFWGRQAALLEQSSAAARAAGLDAAAASLALSGSVTQTYVDLQRNLELQGVAHRARTQRERLVELARRRVAAGLDTPVEQRSAEAALAQVDLALERLDLAEVSLEHALAELCGVAATAAAPLGPPSIDLERALTLPAVLPADLLSRRPDVIAAKARIGAARAGQDAAHAAFYPNVDLRGFVGVMGISLDKIFQGDSQAWQVGPALHLPIFDAGRLRASYRRSAADLDSAIAGYNQAVLRAVRESSDQLARVESLERQLAEHERALVAARDAYRYAEQRYAAGISSYLTVLNAETELLNAERQRVDLLADRLQARVALLVALGGSFDSSRTVPPTATAGTRPAGK